MTSAEPLAAPRSATVRTAPIVAPGGQTTRLPLVVGLGYVVATFLLFLVWPIDWPIYAAENWAKLIAYVALCVAALGAAAWIGSAGATRVTAPLPRLASLLALGAVASVLLLVPTSYAYTGRPPWQVLEALRDQGAAYRRLQVQLFETAHQHMDVSLLRAALAPLTYAVLPLGLLRWRTIGWLGRLSVGLVAAASVVFSIMRGTDKEIADLLIVGASAAAVALGRRPAAARRLVDLARRHWRWGLAAVVFLYLAQGLYTERKDERLNATRLGRAAVCANNSHICANLDHPWIAWLPPRQRFGLSIFILSTCSGYYGLDLALGKPFEPSFGVGHSPAALSTYEAVTHDLTPHHNTYTWRNGDDGWVEDNYWSTLVTWIANDVGFPGAVLVLALIGYLWGRWWREASAGMSDPAAVLFALTTTMVIYFPANNQVFLTPDGYAVFSVWTAIWLWHRTRRRLSARVAVEFGTPA